MAQSRKSYASLSFTNSVPKFLQSAIAKHGDVGAQSSTAADNEETKNSTKLVDGYRKDTEFEKPMIANVENINDLSMEQRAQLKDIMRVSQMEHVQHTNDHEARISEDDNTSSASKVLAIASIPTQTVIGAIAPKKSLKWNKKRKAITSSLSNNDDENYKVSKPMHKKRKVYQEMNTQELKKQRKRKLVFKTQSGDATSHLSHDQNVRTPRRNGLLSFDQDDDDDDEDDCESV
mmetsp:Transcript_57732/g.95800  ORF Transcript_57732/g.95800 Transcript_57732/m.95800 type:complete len:233 (+) Transcript_57732:37-735(+)